MIWAETCALIAAQRVYWRWAATSPTQVSAACTSQRPVSKLSSSLGCCQIDLPVPGQLIWVRSYYQTKVLVFRALGPSCPSYQQNSAHFVLHEVFQVRCNTAHWAPCYEFGLLLDKLATLSRSSLIRPQTEYSPRKKLDPSSESTVLKISHLHANHHQTHQLWNRSEPIDASYFRLDRIQVWVN